MFSGVKRFLCRHRRKLIFSGFVVGGAILSINFIQKKFSEWQEKEIKDLMKKTKKEQHFKNTERTCNKLIFSLSIKLKESVYKSLDTDVIIYKIREGDENRVQLWEELKVLVFAQICTLLYSGVMLVVLLRIQLNIIGGYMIRENDQPHNSSFHTKYLSLSQHFLTEGVISICDIMKKHATLILKDFSLKQKMTLRDIEQVFWQLESSLNQDPLNPLKNIPQYFMYPEDSSETQLENDIMFETFNILHHEEVSSATESSLKRAFSNAVDKIADYYVPSSYKDQKPLCNSLTEVKDSKVLNVADVTVSLAKLVPILHGLYRGPVPEGCPDPWIEQFILMEQINNLGADLHETFSFEDSK